MNGTNDTNKMTEIGNVSPPICCFVLFYCLKLLVDIVFDKMHAGTLKHSALKDKTERPIGKKKRTKEEMLDSETQKSPKNETSRPIKNAKKFLKNFPRPMFIEVPFYTSLTLHVLQAYVAMGKTHVLRILSWVSIQTNNCQ